MFFTASGVRHTFILAPALLCVAVDWIIDHVTIRPGIDVDAVSLVYAHVIIPAIHDITMC